MLNGIKCKYIINDFLFPSINKLRLLKIIKYNKKSQLLFNISLNDFKTISQIVIILTISKYIYSEEHLFINYEQRYKPYFHVFLIIVILNKIIQRIYILVYSILSSIFLDRR